MEVWSNEWLWMWISAFAAVLALSLVATIYRRFPPEAAPARHLFLHAVVAYTASSVSILSLFWWFQSAVYRSGLALDRIAVFSLNLEGWALLFVTVLWLQTVFVWVHRLMMEVEAGGLRGPKRMLALILGILVALPVSFFLELGFPWLIMGLILLGFLGLFDLFIERRVLNLTWMAVWMAVLSAGAAYGLSTYSAMLRSESGVQTSIHNFQISRNLDALAQAVYADSALEALLSTPVPFTVSEPKIREKLDYHGYLIPDSIVALQLDKVLVVNPTLRQSVVEGRSFEKALPWLNARQRAGGRSWIKFEDTLSAGYALIVPDTGTLGGNIAFCIYRPLLAGQHIHGQGDFSLFSAIFLLLIFVTFAWILLGRILRIFPVSEVFPFLYKPSLRNRIQIWLAGFTFGAFLLIGWVSYAFFQRSGILEPETMSAYFSALLTLYVFLLLAAFAVAVVVGNSITLPLAVIGEKLQALRLGRNEPLEWSGQDELGALVSAYNRMIVEVEQSAEMLRRSEREGAWREMARQVAHEIKNPLTPMKLSIQHLQRAYLADPQQAAPLVKSVSETLIEQIETLNRIAGEFANFAQMPEQQKEIFDWREVVHSVLQLFNTEFEERQVLVKSQTPELPVMINTDRSHMTRVLNNLLKNALQAMPDEKQGLLEVLLDEHGLLMVRDNGSGIPKAVQARVFFPNFTTKSSGMGLGLAMCKNIMDAADGRIWFETTENQGTVFFVQLPIVGSTKTPS